MACRNPQTTNWRPKRAARDGWDDSEYTRRMTHLLAAIDMGLQRPRTPATSAQGRRRAPCHEAGGRYPDADSDGDGVRNADDCEPHDRYSFPGANEHCDGIDNDCDGTVDFGTRALRLRPGDAETSAPTAVLGPGRDPLTLSFRIHIDGQANRTIEWVGDGVGYATNFVEAINFRVWCWYRMPQDHETQNRDSHCPPLDARRLGPSTRTEESDARVVLYLDGVRYNPATLPTSSTPWTSPRPTTSD